MSNLATLIASTIIISAIITAGTYFVTQKTEVGCANYPSTISSTNVLPYTTSPPVQIDRGFPYSYYRKTPILDQPFICSFYTDKQVIDYGHLGIDLLEWAVFGFFVAFAGTQFRSDHERRTSR